MVRTTSGSSRSRNAVHLVRHAYGALAELLTAPPGAGDAAHGDWLHEAFELVLPPSYPEGARVLRGREGLKRWVATIREVWHEWRFEPERFIPAGDVVVALVRVVAEGGASGVRLERETAHLWTVRDGLVLRCEVFLDRADALEAAGL